MSDSIVDDKTKVLEVYIGSQYQQILKRPVDEIGLKHYTNEILANRVKQSDLPLILRNSDEYKKIGLNNLYQEILSRDVDNDGINTYLPQLLKRKITIDSLRNILIISNEYYSKFLNMNIPMNNFRIPELNRQRFIGEYTNGYEQMTNKTVVIAGLLRDRVSIIPHLKIKLKAIGEKFKDYRVVIIENDSVDGTRQLLDAWAKEDPQHVIIIGGKMNLHKTVNRSGGNQRISKMATLRNIYLEYVEKNLSNFDYLMVNDMDINGYCYLEGIAATIHNMEKDQSIDMVACNGCFFDGNRNPNLSYDRNYVYYRLMYYDTFPYILPGVKYIWNSEQEKLRHDMLYRRATDGRYKLGDLMHKLVSAFCGLAIYRINSLKGKRYGFIPGKISCEHTFLNVQLRNCYVNPSMIYFILHF